MINRFITIPASLILLFSSCSKVEPVTLLKDYEVFFTQDETRVYTYMSLPDNDTMFVKYQPSVENGQKYVTESSYTQEKKMSQRKFKITEGTKVLIEDLTYDYDSSSRDYVVTPAKIKEHRNIENGKTV